MASIEITYPRPGTSDNSPQDVKLVQLLNNNYVLLVSGRIISANNGDDWEQYEPAYAKLTRTTNGAQFSATGHVVRQPFETHNEVQHPRQVGLSWAVSFVLRRSNFGGANARYKVSLHKHDGSILDREILFLRLVPSQNLVDDPEDIVNKVIKDQKKTKKLIKELSKGGARFFIVTPITPAGPVMGTSFVVSGGFSPADTSVTKVELFHTATNQVRQTNHTPFSSPMGYFAASFANVTMNLGQNHFFRAWGSTGGYSDSNNFIIQ
jgi:hypothetical protein